MAVQPFSRWVADLNAAERKLPASRRLLRALPPAVICVGNALAIAWLDPPPWTWVDVVGAIGFAATFTAWFVLEVRWMRRLVNKHRGVA